MPTRKKTSLSITSKVLRKRSNELMNVTVRVHSTDEALRVIDDDADLIAAGRRALLAVEWNERPRRKRR